MKALISKSKGRRVTMAMKFEGPGQVSAGSSADGGLHFMFGGDGQAHLSVSLDPEMAAQFRSLIDVADTHRPTESHERLMGALAAAKMPRTKKVAR